MTSWLRSMLRSTVGDTVCPPPTCPRCLGDYRTTGVTWDAVKSNARSGCFWCRLFENIIRSLPAIPPSYSDSSPDERKWAWNPVTGLLGRESGVALEVVNSTFIRIYTLPGMLFLATAT